MLPKSLWKRRTNLLVWIWWSWATLSVSQTEAWYSEQGPSPRASWKHWICINLRDLLEKGLPGTARECCWNLAIQLCNWKLLKVQPPENTGRCGDGSNKTPVSRRSSSPRSGTAVALSESWCLSVILDFWCFIWHNSGLDKQHGEVCPAGFLDSFNHATSVELSFHRKGDLSLGT